MGFAIARSHAGPISSIRAHVHADAINFRIGGNRSDRDGDIVAASLRVDDVGEQECLAVSFRDAAAKLPAHQRVHFRILVHRRIDTMEKPSRIQPAEMLVQVGVGPLGGRDVHSLLSGVLGYRLVGQKRPYLARASGDLPYIASPAAQQPTLTSGPIPKFASARVTFRCELPNLRTTSNFMILVRF